MNQAKVGSFLRTLRNEKGLTQEQFAEILNVSNRTVSRWENGNNMPDLDVLVQISDYYEIDLRELLDGERRTGMRNDGKKKEREEGNPGRNREREEGKAGSSGEWVEAESKAAEDANRKAEQHAGRVRRILVIGTALWFASQLLSHTDLMGNNVVSAVSDFLEGGACSLILCGILFMGDRGRRIRLKKFKKYV